MDTALAHAFKALATLSQKEVQQLPLLDCSFALYVSPDVVELSGLRTQLANRLSQRLSPLWIQTGHIDEVFFVLSALLKQMPKQISGTHLACAIQRLVEVEVRVGGPYFLGDMLANIHIAIFMRVAAKPLPNLDIFFAKKIAANNFEDTKLTRFGLLCLLGVAYDSPASTDYITAHWRRDTWQTPWRQAVALSILQRTAKRHVIQEALQELAHLQLPNGFWPGEPLQKNVPMGSKPNFTTTMLIASVIAASRDPTKVALVDQHRQHLAIARAARRMLNSRAEPLRSMAIVIVNKVCNSRDNLEITLLPRFFASSLKIPTPLTNKQFTMLGLASMFGWIAYTIYDDFLDNAGTPAKLPIANVAMRASLNCFRAAMPDSDDFQQYVATVFTKMDEANAWEVRKCRFKIRRKQIFISELPRYGAGDVLAARSFAHALTPMAVLKYSNPDLPKRHAQQIESAFRHYLIARQLNDDLRDWLDDTQAGQASYVVTAILRGLRLKPGAYDLQNLLPTMQKKFRQTVMPQICTQILHHTAIARKNFEASQILLAANQMYLMLDKLELSVQQSLDEHAKSQEFYQATRNFL